MSKAHPHHGFARTGLVAWRRRVLVLGCLVFLTGCQSSSEPPAQKNLDEAGILLSAAQVKALCDDVEAQDAAELRILDLRSESDYSEGHVPGALWMNFSTIAALAKKENGMHDADAWSEAVSALGVTRETRVIVYSDNNAATATRAWWLLKYVGVNDVAVMDGGWKSWQESGFEASTAVHAYQSREFTPEFQTERLIEIAELKERLNDPKVQLLDTRSDGEFTGEQARGPRGGRIPGATHLNWTALVGEDGRFKTKDELQKLFEMHGALPDEECITYCQSGGRASAEAFALELLGYPNVRVYYASWQEWGADESVEVQTGAAQGGGGSDDG